jgi:hypothetical protein
MADEQTVKKIQLKTPTGDLLMPKTQVGIV